MGIIKKTGIFLMWIYFVFFGSKNVSFLSRKFSNWHLYCSFLVCVFKINLIGSFVLRIVWFFFRFASVWVRAVKPRRESNEYFISNFVSLLIIKNMNHNLKWYESKRGSNQLRTIRPFYEVNRDQMIILKELMTQKMKKIKLQKNRLRNKSPLRDKFLMKSNQISTYFLKKPSISYLVFILYCHFLSYTGIVWK